ncbi:MAG: hypothetical protein D6806_13745 [Deltaproteobacteria bacterium]|nr:MAG: hypothetical protein D6806_13745 [Deltaproteobacteria bacterium]
MNRVEDVFPESVYRCYQCATCSAVCELSPDDSPFPRKQMLLAQWGRDEKLLNDPAIWYCHFCNDCTVRCPRDARPGEVLQEIRARVIEKLSVPRCLGRLFGSARWSWVVLLGLPLIFWLAVLYALNGLRVPDVPVGGLNYGELVPHWLIYLVFFPLAGFVVVVAALGASKFWKGLQGAERRQGSFISSLLAALRDIATHRRFGKCRAASGRRWGHFWLMWGFVGALVATTLAIVALYALDHYPLEPGHPFKWVGNIAALLLVTGGLLILGERLKEDSPLGNTNAFDNFFLAVVLLVVFSGVLTEIGRFAFRPGLAIGIYIVHLASIFTLFLSLPYSKFAHLVYRTLAMVHERMTEIQPK